MNNKFFLTTLLTIPFTKLLTIPLAIPLAKTQHTLPSQNPLTAPGDSDSDSKNSTVDGVSRYRYWHKAQPRDLDNSTDRARS